MRGFSPILAAVSSTGGAALAAALILLALPAVRAAPPSDDAFLATDGRRVVRLDADGVAQPSPDLPAPGEKLAFFSQAPRGGWFALQAKKDGRLRFYHQGDPRPRLTLSLKFPPRGFRWSPEGGRAVLTETSNWGTQDIPQSHGWHNQTLTWIDLERGSTGTYKVSWESKIVERDPPRTRETYSTPLGRFMGWDAAAPILLFQDPGDPGMVLRVVPGADRADSRAPVPRGYRLEETGTGCVVLRREDDGGLAVALPGRSSLIPLPLSPRKYPYGGYACDGGSRLAAAYAGLEDYKANRWRLSIFDLAGKTAIRRASLEIGAPHGLRWRGRDLFVEDENGPALLAGGTGGRKSIPGGFHISLPPFRSPYKDPNDRASRLPRLLEGMEDGADVGARSTATTDFIALGKSGSKAIPELARQLGDSRADVRANAAKALRFLGPDAAVAVEPLIRLLKDRDAEARLQAFLALREIGTPGAREAIQGIPYREPPPRVGR